MHLLENIIQAWKAWRPVPLPPPASDDQLRVLEEFIEQPLPLDFRAFNLITSGASLFDGNLNLWPVQGQNQSLIESTSWLRRCGYAIPEQILVFGDNGSEEFFGIWLPTTGSQVFPSPTLNLGKEPNLWQ